jgi:transcriptional regulator with XRE-family HTH domain
VLNLKGLQEGCRQKAVGSRIYELWRRAGLEVAQLAEKSGLSHHRILAIENGKVNLNLGTMLILANVARHDAAGIIQWHCRQIWQLPKIR